MASGPVLVLPPSLFKAVHGRPDTEVDSQGSQNETIQAKYTIGDPEMYVNNFHMKIVRNQLTRRLAELADAIAEELAIGFKVQWGFPKEYKELLIYDSCLKIVSRAANRVFVGVPLCMEIHTDLLLTEAVVG